MLSRGPGARPVCSPSETTPPGGPGTGGHHGAVTDATDRLARRYPPSRVPRPVLVGLVAAGTALALGWLVWAALAHATPDVTAQVSAFEIVSDTAIEVTVTVQRDDPSRAATCRVIAQSHGLPAGGRAGGRGTGEHRPPG